jgi:hypothetical protein
MRGTCLQILILILFIAFISAHGTATPPMPTEFYGSVIIDGKPAPIGTIISAQIHGVEKGSITTVADGFYGGPGIFDDRLTVTVKEEEFRPGELEIIFLINGAQASQVATYEPGSSRQLDLTSGTGSPQGGAQNVYLNSTTPEVPPQSSSGSSPPPTGSSTVSYGLDQPRTFKSEDGLAEVSFAKDTMLFSPEGQFLNAVGLRSKSLDNLPPFTGLENSQFSGYAYEIIPEGTYFNPKATLLLKLPPDRAFELIQAGPLLYQYLAQTATWEPISTQSNVFTNEISGEVYEAAIVGLFTPVSTPSSNIQNVSNTSAPLPIQNVSQNMTPIQPVITPQAVITPVEIPNEPVAEPSLPVITPLITEVPVQEQTIEPASGTPFKIPGREFASSLISSVQSRLTGPTVAILGMIGLIVVINGLIFGIYRLWQRRRDNNG